MQAIREAHERIRGMIHRTPVMTSSVLDELSGNRLFFKCENLQKVGAFKARGATNAVFLLTDEEAAKGDDLLSLFHAVDDFGVQLALYSYCNLTRGVLTFLLLDIHNLGICFFDDRLIGDRQQRAMLAQNFDHVPMYSGPA